MKRALSFGNVRALFFNSQMVLVPKGVMSTEA